MESERPIRQLFHYSNQEIRLSRVTMVAKGQRNMNRFKICFGMRIRNKDGGSKQQER